MLATAGFGGEQIRGAARCLCWPCPDEQARSDNAFADTALSSMPRARYRARSGDRRPSAPLGWKSLSRFAQPLTSSVASSAPTRSAPTVAPADTPRLHQLEASLEPGSPQRLDRLGQDCATAPRIRGSAAHSPERLGLYRSQLMTQSADAPRSDVAVRNEALSTPFHPAISARPRPGPLGAPPS